MPSVLQEWVHNLTFMQQGVLLASVRGPDGIKKDHVVKVLCRWLRRSFIVSAFEGTDFTDPYSPGGGSFTGPCVWKDAQGNPSIDVALDEYFRHVDEIPHHFQLHFMHAAEILGYKHPIPRVRQWWNATYRRIVNDMHLFPELEGTMNKRLGDNEQNWRAAEEVTAR